MAKRIVALSGPAGSGKSEAAKYLTSSLGYSVVKFSEPLKNMLRAFYSTVGLTAEEIERRIEGDLKEVADPYLNGHTPRWAMQSLGTEWGRDCLGGDFWINAWSRKVAVTDANVVVDDCRFDNEARAVKDQAGEIVLLKPKKARRKTSSHNSEAGISPKLVDHVVVNDGTIEDLQTKVAQALYPDAAETFGPL
jgi:hypothetical protein